MMSDKRSSGGVLIVVGIIAAILAFIGYAFIAEQGLTEEQFDYAMRQVSMLGANYMDSNMAVQIWCAKNRVAEALVAVVCIAGGIFLNKRGLTLQDATHNAAASLSNTLNQVSVNSASDKNSPTADASLKASASMGPGTNNAWVFTDGTWAYLGDDGKPVVSSWVESNGLTRYVGVDGKLVSNSWVQVDGYNYFVDENGCPVKGQWFEWEGALYLFDEDGRCTRKMVESADSLAEVAEVDSGMDDSTE